jgi:VCBS repeat-containing protein
LSGGASLTVVDPDVSDSVTASVDQLVRSGVTSGLGSSDAALKAMLSVTAGAIAADPGAAGNLAWNFNSSPEAFDYLDEGETLTLTYTVKVEDGQGGTDTETVTVTVTGTNDIPDIGVGSGDSASASLAETNGGLAAAGTLTVVDKDLSDTVTLAVTGMAKAGTLIGLLPSDAALLAMFTATTGAIAADPGAAHNIAWNFASGSEAFDYLDEGETLTLTYTLRATDDSGGYDEQAVTVTITGTNDVPTIGIVGPGDSDAAALADGASPLAAQGRLTAVDPDWSDAVTASVVSVAGSRPIADLASTLAMLKVQPSGLIAANPGGGAANLAWSFGASGGAFDWLAAGETQVLTYVVRVTDDSGATADRNVTITITGTNEAPVVLSSVPAATAVVELADNAAGENTALLTSPVSVIRFADADASNSHNVTVTPSGAGYLGTLDGLLDNAADSFSWTFSVADSALEWLGAGEVLQQYYTVTIGDGQGGTASTVIEVNIVGSNDAAILSAANVLLVQGASPVATGGLLTIDDVDGPETFQAFAGRHGSYGSLSLTAGGAWSYAADTAWLGLAPGQVLTDSFTVLASDGTPTTISVSIAGSDDVAIARMDNFVTDEAHSVGGSLFADNGAGADSDPDSALAIAAVNGDPTRVGQQVTLASGALLTVNANGTFSYNPNHAFDSLTQAAGAMNQFAYDVFNYTLAGGSTATVLIRVNGLGTSQDRLEGTISDNVITGTPASDSFRLEQGGDDSVWGLGSNDGFYFGNAFDIRDKVDGGDGTDTLALQGNTDTSLGDVTNVEVLLALSGSDTRFGDMANYRYDYDLTTNDGNVGAGQTLTVQATGLLPGEDLHFDGSAETDGNFRIFAGQGTDDLRGGAGNDGFFFGADGNLTGADHVEGGGGTDSLALRGNYAGANAVVMTAATLTGIEVVAFLTGHSNPLGGPIAPGGFDYDLTMADANLAAGQRLDILATGLADDESVRFDGRAETDGSFRILSGAGDDTLWGGAGNDLIYGGRGADRLSGGAGADTFVYLSAAESTSTGFDTITGFDWHVDRIDAPGGASRAFGSAAAGALSMASFDANLATGLSGMLGAGQAALFPATGGDMAGRIFAVIDANGIAGYQAGEDLVIELVSPVTPIDPMAPVIA